MSSLGPYAANGIGRPSLTRALGESRARLDELMVQLSTGKVSQSYSGLADAGRASLAMRGRLAAIASYDATAATVTPRIELMARSVERLDAIGAEYKLVDPNEYMLTSGSGTIAQGQAALDLQEAIAALNLEVGGRYLFSGRATDVKPVLSAEAMLADDGAKAGLRTVTEERRLADLGADGRGRLELSGISGGAFRIAEEASGPFGFKIASVSSAMTNATATGPAGSPPAITLGLSGQPREGEQIRIGLKLPDGSVETIALTAKAADDASALGEGEFRIGATAAATLANMRASFDAALKTTASTDLVAASAVQAGEDFFNVAPGAEPARVAGFDGAYVTQAQRVAALQSASALDATGTAALTVSWYAGERAADDPRKTAAATVDEGLTVAYGARADEDGTRRVVQSLAVFSAMTFSADDPDGRARYAALAGRTITALGDAQASTDLQSIAVDLASASRAIDAAGERHAIAKDMAETTIAGAEDVSKEEVSLKLLALQTQLQASYQATATLRQLSLVNFL